MAQQPTCGQGLAAHAPLPAALAALTDAVADTLAVHATALDLADPAARREHAAYQALERDQRQAAARLRALAAALADARDLPMGRHDQRVMVSPAAAAAFGAVVAAERDLRALLRRRLEQDERLLAELNRAAGG